MATLIAACESIPEDALQLSPTTLEDRQRETRIFDTDDEGKILSASVAVLQDLGFTLDESETELGVIVASKNRDATEPAQVTLAIFLALLTGTYIPVDDEQKIRVSLVTRPLTVERKGIAVRAVFQRMVWNTDGKITRNESLDDAELYQAFFDKLSKSVFLEAELVSSAEPSELEVKVEPGKPAPGLREAAVPPSAPATRASAACSDSEDPEKPWIGSWSARSGNASLKINIKGRTVRGEMKTRSRAYTVDGVVKENGYISARLHKQGLFFGGDMLRGQFPELRVDIDKPEEYRSLVDLTFRLCT